MEKVEYNIGLDIGTTSVGWAVVNKNSNEIVKKGNNSLWGVRLFEEAEKASARRIARGTRRRFDRRRKRIKLLQDEFAEEINKVGSSFYQKLQESFYNEKDLIHKKIIITEKEKQMLKDYYKKYPTIYHLRQHLINSDNKEDIRLIYLAIHHIIKYRGNFLYNNSNFNVDNLNITEKLSDLFNNIEMLCPEMGLNDDYINLIDMKKLEKSLLIQSKNDRRLAIKEELQTFFINNKTTIPELQKLFNGNKFNTNKLFNLNNDDYTKIELDFNGSSYDDKLDEISNTLGDKSEILNELKEIYDILFLKNMFKGTNYHNISAFMINKYNVHKEDLKILKKVLNKNRKEYNRIFRTTERNICIYDNYVHNKITSIDFGKEIIKSLDIVYNKDKSIENEYQIITKKISNENFMPRITNVDNGKFPYQFNKDELIKIIENQGKYYPNLLTTTDNNYKLVKLLEFRIPYYVGPLNNTTKSKNIKNPNSWVIKKNDEIITPYNFNQVIDKDASAEEFIKRMISRCTYLLNESAMPSNSIIYSEFKVRNELKQISYDLNGKSVFLSPELQNKIYENLFLSTNKTITEKMLKDYLYTDSDGSMIYNLDFKGYSAEKKFANNMRSYYDFLGDNGIFSNTNYNKKDAEQIIEWITIFEDKDILKRKITQNYSELNETKINIILHKKYTGWSSLSKKLLTGVFTKDNKSIMDLMRETNKNFMQIITFKEYDFQKKIDELNDISNKGKLDYSIVAPLATSPANKKGIYQALKIVQELVQYIGYNPSNISIEMARENNDKKRTNSRYKYLMNLYEKIENDYYINKLKIELTKFKDNDEPLRNEKLFLYFIQEGKSLYSQKPLNIEDLNLYEVDHIIPRTLIKDDSIDNKALVLREENQKKAASFVLPFEFRTNIMIGWWEHLKKCNLITDKKIYRLKRNSYSEMDIEGFINRQLVETRQICKHVANILNNFYENTNIIYLKADVSHNYREKFELYKFRDLNDYHHAHDAYLAAVLGEYQNSWFNKNNINFEELKNLNKKYYESKEYDKCRYGYYVNSLDTEFRDEIINTKTGEVFDIERFNKIIENTLYRNDILLSKKTEIKTGELFNQTKNSKGKKGVPLKKGLDTKLYGSYTSLNPSYAVIVKYTKNNKNGQRLVGIPIFIDSQAKQDKNIVINYVKSLLNLKEKDSVKILDYKIPFFATLNWEGQICSLVGATNNVEVCNAKELKISKELMKKWKYSLNKLLNNSKKDTISNDEYEKNLEEIILFIISKVESEYKLYNNLVPEMKTMFKANDLNNISLEKKENIIKQMLGLLKCNSTTANLKFLDSSYSMAFGKKNERIIEHAIILNKSITGLKKNYYEF